MKPFAHLGDETAARDTAIAQTARGRVLLVDDDPDLLNSLCDLLQPEGFEVAIASSAETACRTAAEFEPDIAVLDIKLGLTNGIDLIAPLKRQWPDLACVIVTGYADTESAVRALREGAEDFLSKPVDPAILLRALTRCRQNQKLEFENRKVAAALRSSEERTRAIMENVVDAIITIDSTGTIDSVNLAAATLFGYEPAELIGGNVARLIGGGDRDSHDGYIQRYLNGGESGLLGKGPREVAGVRKDGEMLELELAVSEARIGNERVFIGTMRDISERKRLDVHLHQSQKMEAIGQLTGGVAHDFNNLLATILGNAELLEDRLGTDNTQVQAMVRAANRGSDLTQRLLAFSRLQPLQSKVFDPGQLFSGMSYLLTRTLAETIEVQHLIGDDIWCIEADPSQMESALLNLVINAGQAMPEGGKLTIEITNETIDQRTAAEMTDATPGRYVAISIGDTGVGMAPEVVARAFDPFFTTKPVGAGSGLGLSMVYGFARQSGGFAAIDSEPRRGTTVRLYLPRVETEESVAKIEPPAKAPRGKGETILVIEDDPAVCDLAVNMLESLGYKVLSASEGAGALEILHATPSIDLILSDVMLPGGLLGPEVARRARRARPDLPVLFMSGYADAEARSSDLLAAGVTVLHKPFRRYDLARQVRLSLAQPIG
jgi:two-component system CheB/CheR fusion protein